MTPLTLAAAQSISIAGDLPGNIARHQAFIRIAAERGVQLLVFPELSLTGYEPALAAELALLPQSPLLQPLRDLARELGVTAVVGMPILLSAEGPLLIGALVLAADGSLAVYSKQHLHAGEEQVFSPGTGARTSHSPRTKSPWRCAPISPRPATHVRRRSPVPASMPPAC